MERQIHFGDSEIINRVEQIFPEEYIRSTEYYEKYFIQKRIKNILPELKEDDIYSAIEFANKQTAEPRKRRKFIQALIEKLRDLV